MLKKVIITTYVLLLVVLCTATFLEQLWGFDWAHGYVYSRGWFVLLWAVLAFSGALALWQWWRQTAPDFTRVCTLAVHLSLLTILCGALLTHLTARQGTVTLLRGIPVGAFEETFSDGTVRESQFPFYLRLDHFEIRRQDGTLAPTDYVSHLTVVSRDGTAPMVVSMNHIGRVEHFRFYQSDYGGGGSISVLRVNRDPWGIGVSYAGYALLAISLLLSLVNPRGRFRQLLHSDALRHGALSVLLLLAAVPMLAGNSGRQHQSAPVADPEVAREFGKLYICYNGRICPMQTFAIDFVRTIHGSDSYRGLDAEQVLLSWLAFPDAWRHEPVIEVKSRQLRQEMGWGRYASVEMFFAHGQHTSDSRVGLAMAVEDGSVLELFPVAVGTSHRWIDRKEAMDMQLTKADVPVIDRSLAGILQAVRTGQKTEAMTRIGSLRNWQVAHAGETLPSDLRMKGERLFNKIPLATLLLALNLGLGLLFLGLELFLFGSQDAVTRRRNWASITAKGLSLFSLLLLTFLILLRGIILGSVPMANGYDATLLVAWLVMVVALWAAWAFRPMSLLCCGLGLLMSGFFLLVNHLSAMSPAIGTVMPVLQSPLLAVHVGIIMFSFALLALTFVTSVVGLLFPRRTRSMLLFTELLLRPALVMLAIGIFVGAVWANISWGNYWSWDPKETWALITLMVYAVPLHASQLRWLQSSRHYLGYVCLAFLSLLMTYFGVNLFMSGMHSYF